MGKRIRSVNVTGYNTGSQTIFGVVCSLDDFIQTFELDDCLDRAEYLQGRILKFYININNIKVKPAMTKFVSNKFGI